jgi:hypothetical protein
LIPHVLPRFSSNQIGDQAFLPASVVAGIATFALWVLHLPLTRLRMRSLAFGVFASDGQDGTAVC